jgi:hypothetical protein
LVVFRAAILPAAQLCSRMWFFPLWVHAVACPDEKTVFVSQEQAWRLDKYVGE